MTSPTSSCFTVTLVTAGCREAAHAMSWRQIADAWPDYFRPARVHTLSVERAAVAPARELGSAALILAHEDDELRSLHKLIDHLWDEMIPGVILSPGGSEQIARLAGRGIVAMPAESSPEVIATTLASLADRQGTIDGLRMELRTASRFQGGLRGEMDKLHEELQLAAVVQREFLPKSLPTMPNVDVRVLFRPCGYVSGDIYDVQRLDEHHLGFFVADAVGHGVPAALMTMVLSRSIQMKEMVGGEFRVMPPSEVLERLNRAMIQRHADTPRFATAIYGVIDSRDRSITLSGAGHPPPLILRDGEMHKIETSGGLLGIFEDDSFDEVSFGLGDEDMLLIYSDGFETAFPSADADEYGRRLPTLHYLDQFVESAAAWRNDGVGEAISLLGERLNEQAGSLHQVDDLTAMMIVPSELNELDQLFHGVDRKKSTPREQAGTPARIEQPQDS